MNHEKLDQKIMKVYMAICWEADPEIDNSESKASMLGVFSTKKLAEESFTRKEIRHDPKHGDWESKHICYEGYHEVKGYVVDEWHAFGK